MVSSGRQDDVVEVILASILLDVFCLHSVDVLVDLVVTKAL